MERHAMATADLLVRACAEVGEGPYWDGRVNALHWVLHTGVLNSDTN